MIEKAFKFIIDKIDDFQEPYKTEIKEQLSGLLKISKPFEQDILETFDRLEANYNIQINITKHDLVDGWEYLLEKLRNSKDSQNILIPLTGEKCEYIIHAASDFKSYLGLLRFKKFKLDRNQEIDSNGNLKGTYNNAKFYLNKIEIEKAP